MFCGRFDDWSTEEIAKDQRPQKCKKTVSEIMQHWVRFRLKIVKLLQQYYPAS